MKAQVIHRNLTSSNCVAILIDFQKHLLSTINSLDSKTLIENAFDLARMASSLGIPTILTTIGAKTFGGPLLPQFQMIFSNREPIDCSTMSVWEDKRVCREVERTGREKLLMAGIWTDFRVALSAIQAGEVGYIEATDRILPSFSRYLSNIAMERLRKMGVEVLLESPIQNVNRDHIDLKDGKISNGILVWAAGVKARHLPLDPEQKRDLNNRITVNEHLEIPGYPGIFLIGDGALFIKNGLASPPTASVAVQEAKHVAQNILLHSQKREPPPFRFHYRGDMASLGFMFGVAEVYGWKFKGFPAWVIWKAFKLGMLPRLKNRFQIVADWLITLFFKRDSSKLT